VTVARVERDYGAVAFAAFVFRVGAAADAGGGDRHDDAVADQHRRAGDAAERIVTRFRLPDLCPGLRVDGVYVAARVAEDERQLAGAAELAI
jgi:hypothetical protein